MLLSNMIWLDYEYFSSTSVKIPKSFLRFTCLSTKSLSRSPSPSPSHLLLLKKKKKNRSNFFQSTMKQMVNIVVALCSNVTKDISRTNQIDMVSHENPFQSLGRTMTVVGEKKPHQIFLNQRLVICMKLLEIFHHQSLENYMEFLEKVLQCIWYFQQVRMNKICHSSLFRRAVQRLTVSVKQKLSNAITKYSF